MSRRFPAEHPPAWGARGSRKHAAGLAVLLLHGLLLSNWRAGVAPRHATPVDEAPTLLWLRMVSAPMPGFLPAPMQASLPLPMPRPVPRPPQAPLAPTQPPLVARTAASPGSARTAKAAPATQAPRLVDVARNPAAPIELTGPAPAIGSSAVAAGPAAPASGPQGAPTSLLGTEATRRVIREIGRQDTLSERAARATGLPLQSSDARMAEAAARAGKGDCLKGEYLGGGACLLSAPFLALAAARGQCAR